MRLWKRRGCVKRICQSSLRFWMWAQWGGGGVRVSVRFESVRPLLGDD